MARVRGRRRRRRLQVSRSLSSKPVPPTYLSVPYQYHPCLYICLYLTSKICAYISVCTLPVPPVSVSSQYHPPVHLPSNPCPCECVKLNLSSTSSIWVPILLHGLKKQESDTVPCHICYDTYINLTVCVFQFSNSETLFHNSPFIKGCLRTIIAAIIHCQMVLQSSIFNSFLLL